MRKLKAILGIVLALAMLCTAFVIPTVASAADTETVAAASDPNLQSKVEDGCILQALCWSYSEIEKNIPAIAAAGFTTVQTSPVQQPKDYSPSTNISGQWWKLYQPASLALAQRSWVGTSAELKSLCTTAHSYGVKIICDVVTNHLGADKEASAGGKGYLGLAAEVKTYDSTLWNGNGLVSGNPYFHQNSTGSTASDGSAQTVTQKVSSGCPDLNTANSTVQTKVINLLKSCIDCGVDGFRFDAAKHIEVPGDSGVGDTSYWTNVLNGANTYASSKGKTMFYYGEILNTVGGGRSMSNYTNLNGGKYRVTDNVGSNAVRNAVVGHNASGTNLSCNFTGGATKAVVWAESHDTYLNTESGNSTGVSDEDIVKTWALVASRKDATPLFFARTNQAMKMGTSSKNTTYKSVAVAEINKFHNKFVGQSEKFGSSGNFAYVARGNSGVVIVNVNGTSASANISGTGLADGSYKDMITGNSFTVSGGTVSGQIGSTGVAVVTQDALTPYVFADQESQTFQGEYIVVNLSTQNAESATYQLENYTPQSFTGSKKIRIGKDYNYGETINLTLTATNGSNTTTTKYTYTKKQAAASGIYIILPKSVADQSWGGTKWTSPFYVYVYDEPNGKNNFPVYQNAFWPGEALEYDDVQQLYYAEIHADSCVKVLNSNGDWEVSDYDLAHSENTRLIISDSAKSAGGASMGNQLPASESAGFKLNGTSQEFSALSGRSPLVVTTKKPGKTVDETGAVDVSKGNTTPTQPTQATQQTQPTQATQATQATQSGDTKYYGDADLSGTVNINDVTRIQMHLININKITDATALILADVDGDGNVKIQDANMIQRNLAGFSNTGKVKQPYSAVTPTQPTQQTQPTQATQATDPAPANTYTLYIKTQITWISSMGAEPYVYDNSTGESYQMIKDYDAYPEVFTAEVPEALSSVTFYRSTSATGPGSGYNVVTNINVSKTNNCIVLTQSGENLAASVEPYVAEQAPSFALDRIYVENDKGWSSVCIYGWGYGLNNTSYEMTNISGTNIWYYDLPQTIYGSTDNFFLLKPNLNSWDGQTGNLAITEPNNCYKLSGSWTTYTG